MQRMPPNKRACRKQPDVWPRRNKPERYYGSGPRGNWNANATRPREPQPDAKRSSANPIAAPSSSKLRRNGLPVVRGRCTRQGRERTASDQNTPAPVSGRRGTVWPGRTGTGRIHRRNQRNGQCSARSQRGTRRSFRRYCIGSSQALAVPAGSCPSHDAALDSIQPRELTPSRRPFLADMKRRNPQPTPVDFMLAPTVAPSRR